jgi:hypothetical protein
VRGAGSNPRPYRDGCIVARLLVRSFDTADVLHLTFVVNNALRSPACFQGHRRLPGNRFPPKRLTASERAEPLLAALRDADMQSQPGSMEH